LGNENTHYCLDQIKARSKANEMVWIFFSLLCSNVMQIAQRMEAEDHKRAAQPRIKTITPGPKCIRLIKKTYSSRQ
jgi:hypothetical protein